MAWNADLAESGQQAAGAGTNIPEVGPGILEIKCPWNRGNTATAKPYDQAPFYYMPQVRPCDFRVV